MADTEEVAPEELEGGGEEAAGAEEADEELEAMKNQVKQMEDEAETLRKIQEQVEEQMGGEDDAEAAEIDGRSIYVGNVDYSATPEELQEHFASCGMVNRVTILCDRFKNPKGFAYIEFAEEDAIEPAIALNDTELKGRQIKVVAKRTNVRGKGKGKGKGKGFGKGKGYGRGKGGYKGYQPFYRPRYRRGYRPY